MENYEHIHYLSCPHFTVGRVDQWGEQGYLLFENRVFSYEEDRKDQCGRTYWPRPIADFLAYAEQQAISVPDDFIEAVTAISNEQNESEG
jgi:hypothetical protein